MATTWTGQEAAPSNNRRALILSLAFGLLSAFLIYRLLSSTQTKADVPVTVPVLVAKQDIPARTVVTAAMLTIKQVPASLRLPNAFTDTKTAVGQIVRSPVSAGEQVLLPKLAADPKEVGFSGQVPAGLRAVSINVSDAVTSGNLLQPGDSVDVIAIFQRIDAGSQDGSFLVKDGQARRVVTTTLAQDVKVLAVAQAYDDTPGQSPTKGAATKPQADATKTVTLAVSPDDAQKIFFGDTEGTLRLALHRFDDHDNAPVNSIDNTAPAIYGGPQAVAPKPSASASAAPNAPASPQR